MGTTQSAISRIEAGRTAPSVDVIERYARAIGQPITLTFGATQEPTTREQQRRRVEKALKGFRFDPWARSPDAAEMKSLLMDELKSGRD
jgi:transcriptional regulator with XRE-family HTH domain